MKRFKAGKAGFTDKAHLKAKGLIPRADGTKRKSDKYKQETIMINWVKKRVEERTSWDGGMLIAIGVIVLIAGPFAKIAAYGAIGYGIWTIWKSE